MMALDETALLMMEAHDPGTLELLEINLCCMEDVEKQVWKTSSSTRANVLRGFRTADCSGVTRGYAKFAGAVQAALNRRTVLADERLLLALRTLSAQLAELDAQARRCGHGSSSSRDLALLERTFGVRPEAGQDLAEVYDEVRAEADADERDEDLRVLADEFATHSNHVRELGGSLIERLSRQAGLVHSVSSEDAVSLLEYELRRAGFQYLEILALCEHGRGVPNDFKGRRGWLADRHSAKASFRSHTNRKFDQTGDPKPSVNMGVRDPL